MANYGSGSHYWDERYKKEFEEKKLFEWYKPYAGQVRKLLLKEFPPTENLNLLHVGCGNSTFTMDMCKNDYKDKLAVMNVDVSEVVIQNMANLYEADETQKWSVADCTNMFNEKDNSYDCALDKGTLDAILCGDSYYNNASNYLKEVARVLKPNGIFVVITYGTPNSRLYYLSDEHKEDDRRNIIVGTQRNNALGWTVRYYKVPKSDEPRDHYEKQVGDAEHKNIKGGDVDCDLTPRANDELTEEEAKELDKVAQQYHYIYVCRKDK